VPEVDPAPEIDLAPEVDPSRKDRAMKSLCFAMLAAIAPVLAAPASGLAQESEEAQGFDPTLEEWQVPWLESRPRDPYVAPDGRVWFVGQREPENAQSHGRNDTQDTPSFCRVSPSCGIPPIFNGCHVIRS